MKTRLFVATVFVALPLAAILARAQSAAPPAKASASGLDFSILDRTADPCVDFYAYACGGWTKNQPIPADRSAWGVAERLQDGNEARLRRILESAATGRDAAATKIGDYYASCMDETAINAAGASALEPLMALITALPTARDLPALVARLHMTGVGAFFSFGAEADFKDASTVRAIPDQGRLGLPDLDYYFRYDADSVQLRKLYVAHVAKMVSLLGPPAGGAGAAADTV